MEKQNANKLDDLTNQLLQMQQHLNESLAKTRQIGLAQQDLSDHAAASEPKLDNILVSHATNPLFVPHCHDNVFNILDLHLKWKFHDLIVRMHSVGFSKSPSFLISTTRLKSNEVQMHLSILTYQH